MNKSKFRKSKRIAIVFAGVLGVLLLLWIGWWIAVPSQVSSKFVLLVNQGEYDDAQQMIEELTTARKLSQYELDCQTDWITHYEKSKSNGSIKAELASPDFGDYLLGRRKVWISFRHGESDEGMEIPLKCNRHGVHFDLPIVKFLFWQDY